MQLTCRPLSLFPRQMPFSSCQLVSPHIRWHNCCLSQEGFAVQSSHRLQAYKVSNRGIHSPDESGSRADKSKHCMEEQNQHSHLHLHSSNSCQLAPTTGQPQKVWGGISNLLMFIPSSSFLSNSATEILSTYVAILVPAYRDYFYTLHFTIFGGILWPPIIGAGTAGWAYGEPHERFLVFPSWRPPASLCLVTLWLLVPAADW